MSNLPSHARVVVIGAGIVGNSMVYHLAKLGWKDIVLLDKGPLPNPGGSTGHASNFIFLVDHSKEMCKFTLDSVKQYKELGVFTQSGGIEVSRTPERVEEFKRRITSGKSWGVDGMHLISPAEVKQLVPFINEKIILNGFYTEGIGTVDSLRAGTLMREYAQSVGALQIFPNTEIMGMKTEPLPNGGARIRAVETDKGTITAEIVIIACGLWSPRIARMAGAYIPLTPAVHQMISVGPVPQLMDTVGEIKYPIVRDMDTNMYERQHGSDMEVGSYAHRPILWEPDDVPSIKQAALSPTEAPFTQQDFDPQMEQALELIPDILNNEQVGIRYAINGLLSLTPDGFPILGETPEVKNLWSVAAIWIKEAPGIARAVAEWMVAVYDGGSNPEIDPSGSDIARFYPHQKTKTHVNARSAEGFNKTYGIVHPREQWASNRNVRLSPYYEREKNLGAVFYEAMGWERPTWYEANAKLLDEFGERVMKRDAEWDARWWSPIINAEHLAMRERVGMVDLSAFAIFDIQGAGALAFMQNIAVSQMDVPIGRVTYTNFLNEHGGIKADLTVMRLAPNHFRVVTGAFDGGRDKKWLLDHLPDDGSVTLSDITSAWSTLGVWGPNARDVLQSITESDFSNDAFPFATCKWVDFGTLHVLASRISYVGELGWELYVPFEQGARLWDMVYDAGQKFGIVPVGIGVYGTTGRLEKSYRLYGNELEQEYNLVEAGMTRKVKAENFIGKAAYEKQLATPPAALLCSLTVDDNTSSSGVKRFMQGREPILTLDGKSITDARGRNSYVTSAGAGPTLGKYILMSYLPPEYAKVGTKLKVEYFGEHYPVTVAAVGATPLLDVENKRIKA